MKHCINPNGTHLTCCNEMIAHRAVTREAIPTASFIALMIYQLPADRAIGRSRTDEFGDELCHACALHLFGRIGEYLGELTGTDVKVLAKLYGVEATLRTLLETPA